jgi:beta-galactosidase
MIRTSFNDGWTVGPKLSIFGAVDAPARQDVTLPHDGARDLERSADAAGGSHRGYYPDAHLSYEKTFEVPEEWKEKVVRIEFEAVYRDALVFVNGDFVAQRPNGYTAFEVALEPYLKFGETNTIRVEARSHEDSRWYSGAGIYRDVWLMVADPVHVALNGVRVTTPDVDPERAVVIARIQVVNETRHTCTTRVSTQIFGPNDEEVATETAPITLRPGESSHAHFRHYVRTPELWDLDSPNLYRIVTRLENDDTTADEETTTFGIRTLQLDPFHGLRINGKSVKLRGGCIHHDNGPLGSAAIGRAEERRVEILKEAGYNAVRSAHNAISRSFLDACDRLGMLVWDELTDVWTEAKTGDDYSTAFPEWWERDLESLIAKDFNHPSVIMYSIGNEILEVGRPHGAVWSRRLAEKVRELDGTRFVTNAINALAASMDTFAASQGDEPVDLNAMIDQMAEAMNSLSSTDTAVARLEESYSVLDIGGVNYAESRYDYNAEHLPNLITVGSETFPSALDRLWAAVEKHPQLVGDFCWTAWEYLGEAGVGRVVYEEDTKGFAAPFPALVSGAGTIDITGRPRPIAYWRQTVWGQRDTPYIAVQRPQKHSKPVKIGPWSWADAVESWSWDVDPGSPVHIDVYSDADEVELLINGTSVGSAKVGEDKACIAGFETTYQPGELTAVAYRNGAETGRSTLRTAGSPSQLAAVPDQPRIRHDNNGLVYLDIAVTDADGTVVNDDVRTVTVNVDGAATLAALGSAQPNPIRPFNTDTIETYDGRAQAIIRPTGTGPITVLVTAPGLPAAQVNLDVTE